MLWTTDDLENVFSSVLLFSGLARGGDVVEQVETEL